MNEEQMKYIDEISKMIVKKILSMKNINLKLVDEKLINTLALKASIDLLEINYNNLGDFGLFDEFTIEQLDNNCQVGELQIYFDEYLNTKIDISRYGLEDLSDLSIRLVSEYEGIKVVVVESKEEKIIQIKNTLGKELRYQNGNVKIFDGKSMHEFVDIKDIAIGAAIRMFKQDINVLTSRIALESYSSSRKK